MLLKAYGKLKQVRNSTMKNKTTSNCGTVELLNQLRHSQEWQEANSESHEISRLDKYIAKGQETKKTIPAINNTFNKRHEIYESVGSTIYEVDPHLIHRWEGKDRPENELGDIEDLAKSFIQIGQQVPCIVRPFKDNSKKYELIVGECRWHAAKHAKIALKVIVHDLDDRMASLIQAVENEKRNNISEFAKGMSYAKKIESGTLSQTDLIDILGISKQQVSRLLSFRKIPHQLFEAISDFRKVSARTAEELSRLSSKGSIYIELLISFAEKIKTGKFGWNRIAKEIEKNINPPNEKIIKNKKIIGKDGRHLFTWRLDNNATPSIHFPKDIIDLIKSEKIDFEEITDEVRECISRKLINLKN